VVWSGGRVGLRVVDFGGHHMVYEKKGEASMKKWAALVLFFSFLAFLPCQAALAEDGGVIYKLEEISKKQDDILKQLAEIKSELQVIKVRATQ